MRDSGTPTRFQRRAASSSQGMPFSPSNTVAASRSAAMPRSVVTNSQAKATASSLK